LEGTRKRDERNSGTLRAAGWSVLRFWEHDVEADVRKVVSTIIKRLRAIDGPQ
jgi:DNA mismatch endonuclease (patch repair protein)